MTDDYFKETVERMMVAYSNNNTSLVSYRRNKYQEIYDYFKANGFPQTRTKSELSLIPCHFQEAIYDSIDWHQQKADLHHMELPFEIDCMFQNGGKQRSELTNSEFEKYKKYCDSLLDAFLKKSNHR